MGFKRWKRWPVNILLWPNWFRFPGIGGRTNVQKSKGNPNLIWERTAMMKWNMQWERKSKWDKIMANMAWEREGEIGGHQKEMMKANVWLKHDVESNKIWRWGLSVLERWAAEQLPAVTFCVWKRLINLFSHYHRHRPKKAFCSSPRATAKSGKELIPLTASIPPHLLLFPLFISLSYPFHILAIFNHHTDLLMMSTLLDILEQRYVPAKTIRDRRTNKRTDQQIN